MTNPREQLALGVSDQSQLDQPIAGINLLTPFAVEYTEQSLLTLAPEIDMVRQLGIHPFGQDPVLEDVDYLDNRNARRVANKKSDLLTQLDFLTATGWAAHTEHDPDKRAALVRSTIDDWIDRRRPNPALFNYQGLIGIATESAEFFYQYVSRFIPAKTAFTDRLKLADQVEDRVVDYQLIKLLASVENNPDSDPESNHNVLQWLNVLFWSPRQDGQPEPYATKLKARLEGGAYDGMIAADLLHAAQQENGSQLAPTHAKALKDMMSLISRAADIAIDDDVIRNLSEAHELWPESLAVVMARHRGQLIKTFNGVENYVSALMRGIYPPPTEAEVRVKFDKSMRDLIEVARKQTLKTTIMTHGGKGGRTTIITSVPKRPPRLRPPRRSTPEEVALPEVRKEPAKIVYLGKSGITYDVGSPQYESIVEQILNGRQRGNAVFAKDVETMLEGLAQIDLAHHEGHYWDKAKSTPYVRLERNGRTEKVALFEYRPAKDPHIKLNNAESKRHRVYFADLGNGIYGLVGIEHKDAQDRFLKALRKH